MRVVAGLKNMRGLMMSTYNGDETYAAPTSQTMPLASRGLSRADLRTWESRDHMLAAKSYHNEWTVLHPRTPPYTPLHSLTPLTHPCNPLHPLTPPTPPYTPLHP